MALDPSIIRLLKKNASTITKAEEAILKGLPGYEKQIFKAVKDQLSKMNKTGGKFDFDETNVNLVNEIDQIMIDTLQGSTYPDQVSKYLQNFDTVTELNSQIHSKLNDIDPEELKNLVDPAKQQFTQDTLNGLTGAGMDTEFIEPVRQELFKNIVAGANSTEVEQALRSMIEGDAARLGGLERYVGQVTRDALNQYDGTVNARIADEFGLDAFQYVGSLIDDSRSQCRKWVSMEVLLKEDLPTLISSAFSNGQGMIPGTNADNFAIYRGGYNCRHQAIPFKMTKREKERLKKDQQETAEEADQAETPTREQLLASETRAQKELNLTYGKSPLTPKNLIGNKVPDQVFILSDNGRANVPSANAKGGSFYSPVKKEVTVTLKSDRYKKSILSQNKVIIHEFAHRSHFENDQINYYSIREGDNSPTIKAFKESQKKVKKALAKNKKFRVETSKIPAMNVEEIAELKKKIADDPSFKGLDPKDFLFNTLENKYFEKYKDIYTRAEIGEMVGSYADTIAALTRGRVGWGHKKSYWAYARGAMTPMEWYAHAAENYFQGNIVFESEFPELFEQMQDYFSKEVIKKNKRLKRFLKPDIVSDKNIFATTLKQAEKNEIEFIQSLTPKAKNIITEFTTSSYVEVNGFLRGRPGFEDLAQNKEFLKYIENLDKLIKDAPKYKGKSKRYINFDDRRRFEEFLSQIQGKKTFKEKGFMSTSIGSDTIERFADGKYRIKVEVEGENGVLIKELSINPEDNEVLFPKGTNFEILEFKKVFDDEFQDSAEYILKLKEKT